MPERKRGTFLPKNLLLHEVTKELDFQMSENVHLEYQHAIDTDPVSLQSNGILVSRCYVLKTSVIIFATPHVLLETPDVTFVWYEVCFFRVVLK